MKFTKSHEWIEMNNDRVGVVGITTHAQKELGEIVFIQLPKIGAQIQAGDEVAIIESTKAAVDISSPVSGTVVEVNENVLKDPSLVNQSPQEKGWLFKMELSSESPLNQLIDWQKYLSLIDG
ncbi:MAG: glycine cleavage system protein GcvH [Simkaniaceae bacterium]